AVRRAAGYGSALLCMVRGWPLLHVARVYREAENLRKEPSRELRGVSTREPGRSEVLQRVRRAPRGARHPPRAALLHAAPPGREDPRPEERARGRAQAGHRPLRRRP